MAATVQKICHNQSGQDRNNFNYHQLQDSENVDSGEPSTGAWISDSSLFFHARIAAPEGVHTAISDS